MKNAAVVSLNFTVCKQLWPKIFQTQGLSQEEIVQWPCPLIDRFSGLLRKMSFLWAVLWASNMPKMHWWPGLRPGPHWESSQRSPVPDLIVGWGGGPHLTSAPRFSRLRRFDPRAPRGHSRAYVRRRLFSTLISRSESPKHLLELIVIQAKVVSETAFVHNQFVSWIMR